MELNRQELATVLVAMRYLQEGIREGNDYGGYPQLEDQALLSLSEIDDFCERLNTRHEIRPVGPEITHNEEGHPLPVMPHVTHQPIQESDEELDILK